MSSTNSERTIKSKLKPKLKLSKCPWMCKLCVTSGGGWRRRSWYRVWQWWRPTWVWKSSTSWECQPITVDETALPWRRWCCWSSVSRTSPARRHGPRWTVVPTSCRGQLLRQRGPGEAAANGWYECCRHGNEFADEQVSQWNVATGEHDGQQQMSIDSVKVDCRLDCLVQSLIDHITDFEAFRHGLPTVKFHKVPEFLPNSRDAQITFLISSSYPYSTRYPLGCHLKSKI